LTFALGWTEWCAGAQCPPPLRRRRLRAVGYRGKPAEPGGEPTRGFARVTPGKRKQKKGKWIKMLTSLKTRFAATHRDIILFISSIALVGFGESIVNSVFNNFLNETFSLSSMQRTFMELPRELPGFSIIFVSAALFFIRTRRLAVVATCIGAVGLVLMAFFSFTFHWMFAWLFIYSLGQHLFMPLNTSIIMELAREGETGKRLGQFNAVRNFSMIIGSFFIVLGFRYLHFNFKISFLMAALFYLLSGLLIFSMPAGKATPPSVHLKFHKEYGLYYWLSILFGTRKQIFLTFAPWVLVTVFHQPTAMLATLLTIAGVAGIVFQPVLGKAIDTLGEKFVLIMEALVLIIVCTGYGYARDLFSEHTAFIIAGTCYIMDQLLMSVNMARSTYLKKIAVHKDHITPTLTMSVSLDHIFSITVALTGGLLWAKWGYQSVFLFGGGIALLNFISALFISIPLKKTRS
jgi:predicted MFS family arabinose efflux permease